MSDTTLMPTIEPELSSLVNGVVSKHISLFCLERSKQYFEANCFLDLQPCLRGAGERRSQGQSSGLGSKRCILEIITLRRKEGTSKP